MARKSASATPVRNLSLVAVLERGTVWPLRDVSITLKTTPTVVTRTRLAAGVDAEFGRAMDVNGDGPELGDRRTIAAMRTAMWPWWVFPAIVGLVVGFLTDDMPLGWYALTFGGALFLTMVALGFYQGKTRWQQKKRAADAEAPAVHENR
jgi:hypothetical protein